MVSLELPTVLSVGKSGKHVVTDFATEICPLVTDFDCHYKSNLYSDTKKVWVEPEHMPRLARW